MGVQAVSEEAGQLCFDFEEGVKRLRPLGMKDGRIVYLSDFPDAEPISDEELLGIEKRGMLPWNM